MRGAHPVCLNPRRGPEAPAGILAGLVPVTAPERAGDGSMRFRIMTKSRKRKNRHGTGQPTSKPGRQSAKPTRPESRAAKVAPAAAANAASPARPRRPTKKAAMLTLLQQPGGAAIPELMSLTGWQAHSVRAVLTGFRKDGKELIRAKDDAGLTRYRLSASA